MAYVKMFREQLMRVVDPLHPGKRIFETRLRPTGAHGVSHQNIQYDADESGWFEVPDEVAVELKTFRGPKGERYFDPNDVEEEVAMGRLADSDEMPNLSAPVAVVPKSRQKKVGASA